VKKAQVALAEHEVLNDLLGYNERKIIQRKDMLNFSLDCVLLAHFVTIPAKTKTIFDFGTGNAPIPLFLSLRTKAKIIGLDIQAEAIELAEKNVVLNGLSEQVAIELCDINEIDTCFTAQSADVVVSNPPFFPVTATKQLNENKYLQIARHELKLTLEALIMKAAYILNNNGYFAFVHRADRLIEIIVLLRKYKLEPKRLQFIYPKLGREANMVLIEARRNGSVGLKIIEPVIVHEEDGSYRQEILALFNKETL
jgi:tRNA1(Val) A37 N6-methylase TrmN6